MNIYFKVPNKRNRPARWYREAYGDGLVCVVRVLSGREQLCSVPGGIGSHCRRACVPEPGKGPFPEKEG